MASIVSKLARAAAGASRAVVIVGGSNRAMAPRLYPIGWRHICSAVSPGNNKVERDDPKSPSEAAAGPTIHPAISLGKNTSEISSPCSEEETPTKDPSKNLNVDARSLESDEALWALYEYWCKHHRRERTRAEMKRRFKWFRKSALRVHKANSGGAQIAKLSQYSDLRPMEMPRNLMMSVFRRRTR